jgi:hypothetical protein
MVSGAVNEVDIYICVLNCVLMCVGIKMVSGAINEVVLCVCVIRAHTTPTHTHTHTHMYRWMSGRTTWRVC